MNRSRCWILVLVTLAWTNAVIAANEPPNIILIMVDDMGWSDIGCYGSEIETPNIDQLAADGMLFTNLYNNGKCTTTRASLLTGLYPRNGGRGSTLLTSEMLTIGEALRRVGYQTGLSGKWHNGSRFPHRPIDRGFDTSYGLWDGCCNFFDPSIRDPDFKKGNLRFFGQDDQRITEFPEDFYTTDAFTDHAIATIRKHASNGKPFFHYLPYTAPHYPLHAKPQDIGKYKGRYSDGWDSLRKTRYQRQVSMGLFDPDVWPEPGRNPNNKSFAEGRSNDDEWEMLRMEVYAAMVDSVDQNIGRVLATLDEVGVADDTLIVFLSDNGSSAETPGGADNTEHRPGPKQWYSHVGPNWAHAHNTPFRRYKTYTHEGGIATPCVVRWPSRIEGGQRTAQVGHIIDLLPTFLEAAGGDYPEANARGAHLLPLDGMSLLPVLAEEGNRVARPAPLFWHWNGHRAVRDGVYKAVWENRRSGWELYDLSKDRTETNDLAKSQPARTAELAEQWIAWAKMTDVRHWEPSHR